MAAPRPVLAATGVGGAVRAEYVEPGVARPYDPRRLGHGKLFIAPAILTGIGTLSLIKKTDLTTTDLTWVITGAVLGAALGALRGTTVQLVDKGGVLWQRYTGRTFLTLIGALAVTAGFHVLAVKMGMHENAHPLQLSIGVSFLGESLMVARRGMASGIPFAPARTR